MCEPGKPCTPEEISAAGMARKSEAQRIAELAASSFKGLHAPGARLMRYCEETLHLSPEQGRDLLLLTAGFMGATLDGGDPIDYHPGRHEQIMLLTGGMVVATVTELAKAMAEAEQPANDAQA
ncbi:MAG TPA: hypothetical protein VF077_08935 [Nitrospiraceae bacterium]